jgi:hypothetical protein
MSSMAAGGPVTISETGSEQLPASPGLALAEPPAPTQHDRHRPLEAAQCSLCGSAHPLGLLVPDGGQACADIRWYCRDAKSCTERWTTARPPRSAHTPAAPGTAAADTGEPAPQAAPAERLDGMLEQAQPAA